MMLLTVMASFAVGACGAAPSVAPSSSPEPSAPASASVTPSTASASAAPALTGSFASDVHGISISYPIAWATRKATEPWTTSEVPNFDSSYSDLMYDKRLNDHLFLGLASQPLDGKSAERWAADLAAVEGCAATEPVVVDGVPGVLGTDCQIALVVVDDRGYSIRLYTSSGVPEAFDEAAWLKEILTTARLRPDEAVDPAP
jgi:hypothetical protein